jgi:hypothetical protein
MSANEKTEALNTLKQAFHATGPLPKSAQQAIQARFNGLLTDYQQAAEIHRLANAKQAWLNVFTIKAQINAYHNALQDIANQSGDTESLAQAIKTAIHAVSQWPASSLKLLEAALAQCSEKKDLSINAQAMRLLCIQSEIILDITSPAEDKPLRMQEQMNRLQHSLTGQLASQDQTAQLQDVYLSWLASPVVSDHEYEQLSARFLQHLK